MCIEIFRLIPDLKKKLKHLEHINCSFKTYNQVIIYTIYVAGGKLNDRERRVFRGVIFLRGGGKTGKLKVFGEAKMFPREGKTGKVNEQ